MQHFILNKNCIMIIIIGETGVSLVHYVRPKKSSYLNQSFVKAFQNSLYYR